MKLVTAMPVLILATAAWNLNAQSRMSKTLGTEMSDIEDVEPEAPRFENPQRVMFVTDALGRRIPPKKAPEKIFAVLDSSKSTSATDVGKILSLHRSAQGARIAADKVKHSKVLQLKNNREWAPGEHCSGPTDIIWANPRWS
jgi:hypothetical protein